MVHKVSFRVVTYKQNHIKFKSRNNPTGLSLVDKIIEKKRSCDVRKPLMLIKILNVKCCDQRLNTKLHRSWMRALASRKNVAYCYKYVKNVKTLKRYPKMSENCKIKLKSWDLAYISDGILSQSRHNYRNGTKSSGSGIGRQLKSRPYGRSWEKLYLHPARRSTHFLVAHNFHFIVSRCSRTKSIFVYECPLPEKADHVAFLAWREVQKSRRSPYFNICSNYSL